MMRSAFLFPLLLAAAACTQPGDAPVQIVVGATLVNPGGERLDHAVILVDGGAVKAVGPMSSVPIPTGSRKISGIGRFVAPLDPARPIRAGAPASFGLYETDPDRDPAYAARPIGKMVGARWESKR